MSFASSRASGSILMSTEGPGNAGPFRRGSSCCAGHFIPGTFVEVGRASSASLSQSRRHRSGAGRRSGTPPIRRPDSSSSTSRRSCLQPETDETLPPPEVELGPRGNSGLLCVALDPGGEAEPAGFTRRGLRGQGGGGGEEQSREERATHMASVVTISHSDAWPIQRDAAGLADRERGRTAHGSPDLSARGDRDRSCAHTSHHPVE